MILAALPSGVALSQGLEGSIPGEDGKVSGEPGVGRGPGEMTCDFSRQGSQQIKSWFPFIWLPSWLLVTAWTTLCKSITLKYWPKSPLRENIPFLRPQLQLLFGWSPPAFSRRLSKGRTSPAPRVAFWGDLEDSRYLLRPQGGVTFPELLHNIPVNCSEQKQLYSPFWDILCSRQSFLQGVTLCVCVFPTPQPPPSWQSGEIRTSLLSPTLLIKPDTHLQTTALPAPSCKF